MEMIKADSRLGITFVRKFMFFLVLQNPVKCHMSEIKCFNYEKENKVSTILSHTSQGGSQYNVSVLSDVV
jgi:hypothetical protein